MGKLYRIYGWRNIHTDEWYVGCTSRFIEDRAGKNGVYYFCCPKFAEAIKKYGWDSFEQNILRLCTTKKDAIYWEQYWIKELNSIECGYNINKGTIPTHSVTPHLWTEEERQKAREYSLANDPRDNEIWKKKMKEKVFPTMRPVKMIDKETGEVIRVFESKGEAARFIDPFGSNSKRKEIVAGINRTIRGIKLSAYGFKWESV